MRLACFRKQVGRFGRRRSDQLLAFLARVCPSPITMYFVLVSSGSPIGPLACSFCVEMPISAPKPNSPPSVNRVEALTITAAASTRAVNARAAAWERVMIDSVCDVRIAPDMSHGVVQ